MNGQAVDAILARVSFPVQLGGGIRDLATVEGWLAKGVARVIIGTAAVRDPAFVKAAARAHPGRIVVGIDGKTVTTIEGNTSGTGDQRNGGMVMVKKRTIGKEVVGFGRPKYVPYKGEFPKVEMPTPTKAEKPKKEKKWSK
jgi:imidazole glycerol phosphate synthase subunit HisF